MKVGIFRNCSQTYAATLTRPPKKSRRAGARLYLSDLVVPWNNGPAAWAEEIEDISYDGSQSHELRAASGPLHHINITSMAFISNGRDMMLHPSTRNWTGAALAAQYYHPYPISQVLAHYTKEAKMPDVCEQTLRGLPAIRLHFGYEKNGKPFSEFNYWFAPTRGFAYLKEDLTLYLPDRTRYTSTEVIDFKAIGANLWFPTRAVRIQEDPQKPGTYLRYTWQTDDIIANDPNFDPKAFTAPILPGWIVSDIRTSTRVNYIQMPDGSHYILRWDPLESTCRHASLSIL